MIVHSDWIFGFGSAFLVIFVSALGLFISVLQLLDRRFRSAAKTGGIVIGLCAGYVLAVVTVSVLSPQRVVNIGDTYCADIWCIGIQSVSATPRGNDVEYNVGVRIFSDANTITISAKNYSLYLVDDQRRRFPLVENSAAIPFDTPLEPGQSINTSLTFVTASDARQLFLTSEDNHPGPFLVALLVSLYFGNDNSLMHKPTLLRVL